MNFQNLSLIAYIFLAVIVFEFSVNQVDVQSEQFEAQKQKLKEAISQKQAQQIKLKEMIMSESDPAFIELTLMRVLGVIPEGTKKITFHD
jgi:Tfp pilus assembly protein PilV